jgi:hypothetical protein
MKRLLCRASLGLVSAVLALAPLISNPRAGQQVDKKSDGTDVPKTVLPVVCFYIDHLDRGQLIFSVADLQNDIVKFLSDPRFGIQPVAIHKDETKSCDFLLTMGIYYKYGTEANVQCKIISLPAPPKIKKETSTPVDNYNYRRSVFPAAEMAAGEAVRSLKLKK